MEGSSTMSLLEKYAALDPKEQRALKIAAVAVVFFILYQFGYEPYQASIKKLTNQIRYQADINVWLTKRTPQLDQISSQTHKQSLSSSQLLGTTSSSLRQAKLDPFHYNLQQSDGSSIQLTFKLVPYTAFIKWMESFWHRYPLTIKELAIASSKNPGMVRVSLQFDLQ